MRVCNFDSLIFEQTIGSHNSMQQSLEDMQRPIIYLILFLLLCIHVSLSFDDDVWYANEQDITCSLSRFLSFSFDYSFSFATNIWNCQKHQGYLLHHNIGINRYHHDIYSFRLFFLGIQYDMNLSTYQNPITLLYLQSDRYYNFGCVVSI